jgi:hypothetical protein
MDTVDFLRLVLPEDGYYVGAILAASEEGSFFRHHFTETIEELDEFRAG